MSREESCTPSASPQGGAVQKDSKEGFARKARLGVILALFLALIFGTLVFAPWPGNLSIHEISGQDLGVSLFENYGVAFLIVGVVLFVSMLGGVFLAQEEKE